jgi:hypothetical protein
VLRATQLYGNLHPLQIPLHNTSRRGHSGTGHSSQELPPSPAVERYHTSAQIGCSLLVSGMSLPLLLLVSLIFSHLSEKSALSHYKLSLVGHFHSIRGHQEVSTTVCRREEEDCMCTGLNKSRRVITTVLVFCQRQIRQHIRSHRDYARNVLLFLKISPMKLSMLGGQLGPCLSEGHGCTRSFCGARSSARQHVVCR